MMIITSTSFVILFQDLKMVESYARGIQQNSNTVIRLWVHSLT